MIRNVLVRSSSRWLRGVHKVWAGVLLAGSERFESLTGQDPNSAQGLGETWFKSSPF